MRRHIKQVNKENDASTISSIVLVGTDMDSWDKEELPESSVSVVALIPPIEIIQNLHLLAADVRVIVSGLVPLFGYEIIGCVRHADQVACGRRRPHQVVQAVHFGV